MEGKNSKTKTMPGEKEKTDEKEKEKMSEKDKLVEKLGGENLGEKLFYQRQINQGLTAQLRGSTELSRYSLPSLMDSFLKRNNSEVSMEDLEASITPPKETNETDDYDEKYEIFLKQKAIQDAIENKEQINFKGAIDKWRQDRARLEIEISRKLESSRFSTPHPLPPPIIKKKKKKRREREGYLSDEVITDESEESESEATESGNDLPVSDSQRSLPDRARREDGSMLSTPYLQMKNESSFPLARDQKSPAFFDSERARSRLTVSNRANLALLGLREQEMRECEKIRSEFAKHGLACPLFLERTLVSPAQRTDAEFQQAITEIHAIAPPSLPSSSPSPSRPSTAKTKSSRPSTAKTKPSPARPSTAPTSRRNSTPAVPRSPSSASLSPSPFAHPKPPSAFGKQRGSVSSPPPSSFSKSAPPPRSPSSRSSSLSHPQPPSRSPSSPSLSKTSSKPLLKSPSSQTKSNASPAATNVYEEDKISAETHASKTVYDMNTKIML